MQKVTGCLMALAMVLMISGNALAEETVTLKGVHLCCGGCLKGVGGAAKKAGATAKCDKAAGTVTITAADAAGAQKAVDAVAKAGYYGTSSSASIKIKPAKNVPDGKVKSITLLGAHNCCGKCTKAISGAIKSVSGAATDAKAKDKEITVTGEFDAKAVVAALNKAGISVRVKK